MKNTIPYRKIKLNMPDVFLFLKSNKRREVKKLTVKNICADDLVRSAIPAQRPYKRAISNRIVLTSIIEKNSIQIKAALTPESTMAIRS